MQAGRVLKISHTGQALQSPAVGRQRKDTLDRTGGFSGGSAANHWRFSPMEHV